jgi:hypothetical protein
MRSGTGSGPRIEAPVAQEGDVWQEHPKEDEPRYGAPKPSVSKYVAIHRLQLIIRTP